MILLHFESSSEIKAELSFVLMEDFKVTRRTLSGLRLNQNSAKEIQKLTQLVSVFPGVRD